MAAGNKVECGACKRPTPKGIKCMYCGALLVEEVECAGCQRKLAGHITQCLYCGTKRVASAKAQEAAAARAPQPQAPAPSASSPAPMDNLLMRAMAALGEDRMLDALSMVDVVLEARPGFIDAHMLRGEVLRRLGRYEGAINALRRATELQPDRAASWMGLANLEMELEMKREAMASLLACLRYLPAAPIAQRSGLAALLRKHFGTLGKNVAVQLEEIIAHGARGEAWPADVAQRIDEQRQAVLQARPATAAPAVDELYLRGLAQEGIGDLPAAITTLRAVVAQEPTHQLALIALGRCLMMDGQPAEAEKALAQAVRIDPKVAAAWIEMGNLKTAKLELQLAVAAYRRAIEIDPGNEIAQKLCADVLARLSRS